MLGTVKVFYKCIIKKKAIYFIVSNLVHFLAEKYGDKRNEKIE